MSAPLDPRPLEQRAREAWESDARLREEFLTLEDWLAYARARERGAVRFLGRQL